MKYSHIHVLVEYLTIGLSAIATILFGTWIPLMNTLLILNGTDIATGLLKGGKKHQVGSEVFYSGIRKKVGQWILIIVANAVDSMAFGDLPVAKTAVVGFLIAYEGISITENLAEIGVPIPEVVTKYLVQIRDDNEAILEEKFEEKETNSDITIDNMQ